MADNKPNLSRNRFLKGFLGTGLAAVVLSRLTGKAPKTNINKDSTESTIAVRNDKRTVSRSA